MVRRNLSMLHNFMGVRRAKFGDARVVVLPIPYEGTVTYGAGTRNGDHRGV